MEPLKHFIKGLRKNATKIILFFVLLFSCLATDAADFKMDAPFRADINWNTSEFKYDWYYTKGENRYCLKADNYGYYRNGQYIGTSYMRKSFGDWKYYVGYSGWVQSFYAYEDTLISTFYYDKETQIFYEYEPKGLKTKGVLIAKYKRVDDNEFHKLGPEDNLISIFSKKNNPQHYWYEYKPDGTLLTKHLTTFLPYEP